MRPLGVRATLVTTVVVALSISPGVMAQECRPVAIVTATLTDNGDNDGFADTRETVWMRLELLNLSDTDLTGLVAEVAVPTVSGPPDVCVSQPRVTMGDLAAGGQQTTQPFVLHLGEIGRTDPLEDRSVTFDVTMTSDQGEICVQGGVTIDLDLDISGGGAPTTFHEGFESGLGSFENLNLDAGLPGGDDPEGLALADGYRCQYNDPDWHNSFTYGRFQALTCFPGHTLQQADDLFWHVDGASVLDSPDGGRAHGGNHSLYYGIYLTSPAGQFTTPLATIEAAGTIEPINLGSETSTLTLFQQISLMDDRGLGSVPPLRSGDRGVVQVQLADSADAPVSDWSNLEPFRSPYDQQAVDNYSSCMFDPIDDGTTEDDFFDPTDPHRRLGPSSTCYPQVTYAHIGDTDTPFDPTHVGHGDRPGLPGSLGTGTWVESGFDLSRYRGRRVRLRFLVASVKFDEEHWEDQFSANPWPQDDGWWIDDVTVTGALTEQATVTADLEDNSGLPDPPGGDIDGDGIADVCDNCDVLFNPAQDDDDLDGLGTLCDACPLDPSNEGEDLDLDGWCALDNCPEVPNPDQINVDGDGFGVACECDDTWAYTYPGAPETNDGRDNQCPGEVGYGTVDEISGVAGFHNPDNKYEFSWPLQADSSNGAFAVTYDVMHGSNPTFTIGCEMLVSNSFATSIEVPEPIGPGRIRYYLIRANAGYVGFEGSFGATSSGAERVVPCAP